MAQEYTLDDLQKMGAQPAQSSPQSSSQSQEYSLQDLQNMQSQQSSSQINKPGPFASLARQNSQSVNPLNEPGIMKTGSDFLVGAAKGAADLPREAASAGNALGNAYHSPTVDFITQHVLRPILQKILTPEELSSLHGTLSNVQQGLEGGKEQTNFTTPQNTAQKVGFGAEKVGEFFLPGGAIEDAGKGIEVATKATELPEFAKGAINLAGKSALEGSAAAGQTYLQSGGNAEQAKTAGLVSAAFPIASKVLSPLKDIPESAWSSILKRTSAQVAKNPDLPTQAAETGMVALTKKGLAEKAGGMIQQIETHLDDVLGNSTAKINVQDVANHLDALKEAYSKIPGESSAVNTIDAVKNEMLAKGQTMTPVEANQLKRDIYGMINKSYGKGLMEIPAKQEAQKTLARGLKEEIEKVAPEVKGLNQQQGVYIQIKKALDKQLTQGEGKGAIPMLHLGGYDLLTGLGGLIGVGAHSGAPGAVAAGVAAVGAKKAAESTAFLTSAAKIADYFNGLSPTKKMMFYNGLKGLVSQGSQSIK